MNHPTLNLPDINPKIKTEDTQEFIFDSIRKKYLVLTPEEWVRQHFVEFLTKHLNYPAGLIQMERQHEYFKSKKRSDILIFGKKGQAFLLVECKSFDVKIAQSTLNQVATYNKTLDAPFIGVTNGLKHFVWELANGEYVQLKQFPTYPL